MYERARRTLLFLTIAPASTLYSKTAHSPFVHCRISSALAVESWYDLKVADERRKTQARDALALKVLAFQDANAIATEKLRFQHSRKLLEQTLAMRQESARLAVLKADLLALAASVNRGANATQDQQAQLELMASELEAVSPTSNPLDSSAINGRWQLAYTTSASILGLNQRFRPFGPIYQWLHVPSLTARNEEVSKWGRLKLKRFVEAELQPLGRQRVSVDFKRFGISWLRIPAPKRAVGQLDITYLDDELRISRGDKGNLFVLFKDNPLGSA